MSMSTNAQTDLPKERTSLREELSDEKFIAWSRGTYEDSYDVTGLADFLNQSDKTELAGLDVGGGIGMFATRVVGNCPDKDLNITVVDPGLEASKQQIQDPSVDFVLSPFNEFESEQRYDFIIFRLVLHHLIGENAKETAHHQLEALKRAKSLLKDDGFLFIVENFYEPMIGTDTTSQIIYRVTSSKAVATITRKLGANTAGEGVRFRSMKSWTDLFTSVGFDIVHQKAHPWGGAEMPLWQRLPLLCQRRFQGITILR